jgi:hypothetical protein
LWSIRYVDADEEKVEDEIGSGIEKISPCCSVKYRLDTRIPLGEEGIVRVRGEGVKEEKKMIVLYSRVSIVGLNSLANNSTVVGIIYETRRKERRRSRIRRISENESGRSRIRRIS